MNAFCYKTLSRTQGNDYWDMKRHCYNSLDGCNAAYATAFPVSRLEKLELKKMIKKALSLMDLE